MSQLSKTKISKVFTISFEVKPKGAKKNASEGVSEFFVKHFGRIQFSPRYKVTVEVVKSARSSTG